MHKDRWCPDQTPMIPFVYLTINFYLGCTLTILSRYLSRYPEAVSWSMCALPLLVGVLLTQGSFQWPTLTWWLNPRRFRSQVSPNTFRPFTDKSYPNLYEFFLLTWSLFSRLLFALGLHALVLGHARVLWHGMQRLSCALAWHCWLIDGLIRLTMIGSLMLVKLDG